MSCKHAPCQHVYNLAELRARALCSLCSSSLQQDLQSMSDAVEQAALARATLVHAQDNMAASVKKMQVFVGCECIVFVCVYRVCACACVPQEADILCVLGCALLAGTCLSTRMRRIMCLLSYFTYVCLSPCKYVCCLSLSLQICMSLSLYVCMSP